MIRKEPKVHDLPLVLTFVPALTVGTKLNLSNESLQFLAHVESNICNASNNYSSILFDLKEVYIISDDFKTALFNLLNKYYSVEAIREKVKFLNVPTRVKEARVYMDENGNFAIGAITKI